MSKQFIKFLRVSFLFLDFCSINIVFIVTYFFFRQYNFIEELPEYLQLSFCLNTAWFAAILLTNTYNRTDIVFFETFTKRTIYSYLYFILLVIVCLFFLKMVT